MQATAAAVLVGLAVAELLYVGMLLLMRKGLVLDTTGVLTRMIRVTFARA
jgi:hypothetical protein